MEKNKKSNLIRVAELGNPILRKKAKKVKDIKDKKIKKLIKELLTVLLKINGVGMAAPQLFQSQRIFIVASHPNKRYPHAPMMKPLVVINPKIISYNNKKEKGWEGCLSIPEVRALVPRFTEINVEFTNKTGKRVKKTFKDFIARIFQHEYDHLEGLVFLDRVEGNKDIISDSEYQKLMEKKTT